MIGCCKVGLYELCDLLNAALEADAVQMSNGLFGKGKYAKF